MKKHSIATMLLLAIVCGCMSSLPGCSFIGGLRPTPKHNLAICLADAPVDTCEDVNVGISRVFVKPFDSGSWVLIEEYPDPVRVNLLDLRINEFVMSTSVPVGVYEEIRLLLDAEGYVAFLDGSRFPLVVGELEDSDDGPDDDDSWIGDDEQAIEIEYAFEVYDNRITEILVDFDLAKVLQANEFGDGYVLDPEEIEAVDKHEVGEIEGEVIAEDGQPIIDRRVTCELLDGAGIIIRTTLATWEEIDDDDDEPAEPGKFKIRAVMPGEYSLRVTAEGYMPAEVCGLVVSEDEELELEEIWNEDGITITGGRFDEEGRIVLLTSPEN
ncbi:MAG: DUF4382 domain-containing protein [Firmicutes bacterium]|nr:DUF4382 domain-containing protein [Bacillota bacterium]